VTDTISAHKNFFFEKLVSKIYLSRRRKYNIGMDLKELVSTTVLIWFGITGSTGLL